MEIISLDRYFALSATLEVLNQGNNGGSFKPPLKYVTKQDVKISG